MSNWTKTALVAIIGFLLNEDGTFLLQENSGKIVLDRDWDKNEKQTGTFTKVAKESLST